MTECRVELIQSIDQTPLRATWNRLISRNEVNEIFLTHEWVFSWLDAFWGSRALFFLATYENDGLTGIAPLLVYDSDRSGNRINALGFVGRDASDYNDFIIVGDKKRTLRAMFDYILDAEGFDLVELVYVPEYSSTLSILRHYFRDRNVAVEISLDIVCPTHVLNEESERIFDKKTKQPRRKLSRLGAIDCFTLNEPGAIAASLPEFFDQHIDRRSVFQADEKSKFLQADNRRFFLMLTHRLPGVLFSALSVDGNYIAFHFGFTHNGKFLYYTPSFDRAYARYSPGLVLLNGVFHFVKNSGLKELDFTIGAEHYKTRFANKTRATTKVCFQRSPAPITN